MTERVEIIKKVYGFVNQIKAHLALKDIAGVWKVVNALSEYLVSIDCTPTQRALDSSETCDCGEPFPENG